MVFHLNILSLQLKTWTIAVCDDKYPLLLVHLKDVGSLGGSVAGNQSVQ